MACPALLVIRARCSRNQLIRQIEFLSAENEMLRKLVRKRTSILNQRNVLGSSSSGKPLDHKLNNSSPSWICLLSKLDQKTQELRVSKATGAAEDARSDPELVLWQCDFFSKRVFSRLGMPQLFAMVFLNVATRRVWISPATCNPTEAWVMEQAKAFIAYTQTTELKVGLVTRDNDQIYKKGFDQVMDGAGIRAKRLALRSPNLIVYVERFIQTIQVECLDHFLIFGERHFNYLVREYIEHYHNERPHQTLDNRLLSGKPPTAEGEIQCHTRLGGLLRNYYRRAA
jgi:hypothetical protein